MVQGVGATSNILALLFVNLIGYTVGIEGTTRLVDQIFFRRDGHLALAGTFVVLFSGVQVKGLGMHYNRCMPPATALNPSRELCITHGLPQVYEQQHPLCLQ